LQSTLILWKIKSEISKVYNEDLRRI